MSSLYDIGRRGFLTSITQGTTPFTGQIDWEADSFGVVLIDTTLYTHDVTHLSLADIPVGARVDVTPLVGNSSTTEGIAQATNTVFSTVTGAEVSAVVIYRDNGTANEDDNVLVAYIDSAISGLPVTPNGGDITILWNGGNGYIFRL
jgi:hypothetical protein